MTGFRIAVKREKINSSFPARLLPVALCAALWALLCGMMDKPWHIPAAASLLAAYPLFCRDRRRLYIVSSVLFTVGFVVSFAQLQGAQALLNRLFEASENAQAYEYAYFETEGANETLALAAIAALTAVILGFCANFKPRLTAFLTLITGFLLMAYFGVVPDALPTMLLLAAAALMLLERNTPLSSAALVFAIALIGTAVLSLAPASNGRVSELNESLRDSFAVSTLSRSEAPEPTPEPTPTPTPAPNSAERMKYLNINMGGWTKTHTLICIIIATLIVLFVPSIITDRYKKRVKNNRAWLDNKDNAAAVKAGFMYALKWLEAGGYERENLPLEQSFKGLPEMLKAELCLAADIFREGAYSAHEIDDDKRRRMREFADKCQMAALSGKKPLQKLRIKYKYAL